jgi:hypothetical protein
MKLQDKETLNVADAVKNVLEGKKPVQEMDPKKHVKKDEDSGMFCVYNTAGKKVKEFKSKDEAEKWAADNHDDLMSEAGEPKAKGEKDFKDKHTIKKTGTNDDAKVTKEEITITIDEAKLKAGKGKATVDVDFIGDKDDAKAAEKKFKLKIKMGRGTADITGEKKNILAWLSSDMYGMDSDDIEDLFPELMEAYHSKKKKKEEGNAFGKAVMAAKDKGDKEFMFAGKKYKVEEYDKDVKENTLDEKLSSKQKKLVKDLEKAIKNTGKLIQQIPDDLEDSDSYQELVQGQSGLENGIDDLGDDLESLDEMSAKQKKYQAFFNSALKKFGVKSPAELEGDKKKEFYDYVDANYEADNESD